MQLIPPTRRAVSSRRRIIGACAGAVAGAVIGGLGLVTADTWVYFLAVPLVALYGAQPMRPPVIWGRYGSEPYDAPTSPPEPDTSDKPSIVEQEVVEIIYSPSNHVRGIITRDTRGIYRVRTEFWSTGDWEIARIAFWQQEHVGTFTDTLENARKLCREWMLVSKYASFAPDEP